MRHFSLAVVVVMILSGCDTQESSTDLSFRTAATAYTPGSEVAVQLENGSDVYLGYNLCFTNVELERRQDGEWEVVPTSLGPDGPGGCLDVMLGLAPSESAESSVWLPGGLGAGRYRLAIEVEVGIDRERSDRERVVTNPFEVE